MSPEVKRLTESVTALKDASDSATTLLGNLSAMLRERADDPAAIRALADTIDQEKNDLAEAVVANTPAE